MSTQVDNTRDGTTPCRCAALENDTRATRRCLDTRHARNGLERFGCLVDNVCMRDWEIRQVLRAQLARRYASTDPGTLIIDELPICRHAARADLAVINGSLSGYEIKSDRDTLKRLERQKDAYSRVFEYVTVVAAATHIDRLLQLVPTWWGISAVVLSEGDVCFRQLRPPRGNPEQCPLAICQFLWRGEALDILEARGLASRMSRQPRRRLWEKIAEAVPLEELRQVVAAKLKARGRWRAAASRT